MGTYTTKPVREISLAEFRDIVREKNVLLSQHAIDHLSSAQRKVFKEDELVNIVRENPRKAYLQQNGNYAAYFRRKDCYRKIVFAVKKENIIIITFMDVSEIPRI